MPIGKRRRTRKMVDIDHTETSGVDYGATGLEGWIVMKAADGQEIVTKKDFSQEKRDKLASTGAALPGGGFPIENTNDLKNAIKAIGRAKNPAAARAHIIKRARALGATSLLPEDWNVSKESQPTSVEDLLTEAESLAKSHSTLVSALDNATYLEDAPEDVRKAVDDLRDYLDAESEQDRADSPLTEAIKALAQEVKVLKANSGGTTKDEPDKGSSDEEVDDGAGATGDLEEEGEDETEEQGTATATKDAPNLGKKSSVKKAAANGDDDTSYKSNIPHNFQDDGNGNCKICGKPQSGGMHKENLSKEELTGTRKEGRVADEIDRDALPENIRVHIEGLEKALADTKEELTKSKAPDIEEEMLKSLPEPMRKRFEELEEMAKSSAEALRKAKAESDLKEAVAKAREWTHVPGLKPEEFAPDLVALRKSAPDQAAKVEDLFSKVSAAMKESALLKEVGSSYLDTGGDSMSKLDAMAKESMNKSSVKTTYEQEFAKVIATPEGRQLYDEYMRERAESGVK